MKKLLSILLALCLALMLLPGTAWAAGENGDLPEEYNVKSTVEWSYPTITGGTVTQDTYNGKIQILIFFRANGTCKYCNGTMRALADADWVKSDNVQVIAVGNGENGEDAQTVKEHAIAYKQENTPDNEHIVFCYSTNSQMWNTIRPLQSLIGEAGDITYAVNFVFDRENHLRFFWQGEYRPAYYTNALAVLGDSGDEQPGTGAISGSKDMEKLSKEEIIQLLEDNPLTLPDNVFEVEPSYTALYVPGKVRQEALQAALNRLNALRRIAGLPSVALDAEWCDIAQYGAVLLSVSDEFGHYPPQPADMDDSFYAIGYEGTSTSNLAGGWSLTGAVDSLMDDSDASNVSRVGHRRWQLNPYAGKVGFGYAAHGYYRQYVDEKVFASGTGGNSGGNCDFDFIAWPASGNFPNTLFGKDVPWSVSVDPDKYQTPALSAIAVTLTRQSDGKSWTFSGNQSYTASSSGTYFNVETTNRGVDNCIIFRPDGVESYDGLYSVSITGLKTKSGAAATLSYQVDFFNPNTYTNSTGPDTTLSTSGGIGVTVKGETVAWTDAAPFIDANDRTMVPLRAVADAMGLEVNWDAAAREASFTSNGKTIIFPVDSTTARTSEGGTVTMDTAAVIVNDRTYAPIRYLAEYFGYTVDWDEATRTVVITG